MKVFQALADELVAQGVDTVFGLMGDANMFLLSDLIERHGVRYIAARNENAAVMMADGYARATGRCGVATVTQGPGLASAGNALTIARQARTPLVLLAGDTPVADPLHVQNFEQQPFALATAGRFVPVRTPGTARRDAALAFREARTGPGPVVLNAPMDMQDEDADPDEAVPRLPAGVGVQVRPAPDPGALAAVADALRTARRPVILAGRGAEHAAGELVALADRQDAVLTTTLMAAGLFTGHPYALGVAGGLARPLTRETLGRADLVVAFGAGLNRWTADHGNLFPAAAVICVDVDPAAIGARWPADHGLVADAALAAGELSRALPERRRPEWRTHKLAAKIASADPFDGVPDGDAASDGDRIDPRSFMRICARRLPADRTTVVGVGHFGGWPNLYLDSRATDRAFLAPWEFGSIGVGTAFGIGAAAGRPDRPVVVFEGDGSLLTSLGELDTLARSGLPVLVVVLDDAAYGAEVRKLVPRGADPGPARFPPRDLAAVARALGVPAHAAGDAASAEAAFDALLPLRGPALLHVRVARGAVQDRF
ncbi:thiamine pyrophosphate-binding protein [Spirillospora sp. NPDC048819]|uniref:thiamine pyrophosphate-binding protein n=1 Tax=Spirillospora sp. NPDC048819 TaxID=3155268 RepID=UPI0033DCF7BB